MTALLKVMQGSRPYRRHTPLAFRASTATSSSGEEARGLQAVQQRRLCCASACTLRGALLLFAGGIVHSKLRSTFDGLLQCCQRHRYNAQWQC